MVKKAKSPILKDGDVFKIPLGDGRAAVGQIVASYLASLYVVIFDFVAPEGEIRSQISEALQAPPLFGGLTYESLFRPGGWEVLENRLVDQGKFLPAYKVGTSDLGNCMIEDFNAGRRRPATAMEEEMIPFRSTFSAAVYERALKAHLGLEPWHDAFGRVRLGEVVKSADIFGG